MDSDLHEHGPSEAEVAGGAEAKKPSDQILQHEMVEALNALTRPTSRLIFSGLATGLHIGFSVFLMALVRTLSEGVASDLVLRLLVANMYSFGFVLVVLGRSELFTEQTTLAVLPVLRRRASVGALGRMWGMVYTTNLIGAFAFARLLAWIGPVLGVIEPEAFGHIARNMVEESGPVTLFSAVLAGWLMGLLSWLVAAGRETISQIVIVWLIASAIGLGSLHHSIVGSIEVLVGVFSGQGANWGEFGWFLLWTTLGNMLGGTFFAALIAYGHVDIRKEVLDGSQ